MVAKRVSKPPDFTSYNRYSRGEEVPDDMHIGKRNRGAKSGKSLREYSQYYESKLREILSEDPEVMSPLVFYDINDAAKILEKAAVTVRKEARIQQIGAIKGQGYLFNDQDILKLMAIFEAREETRRHPLDRGKPKDEVGIARAVFEQLVYLKHIMLEYRKDRERFLIMFQEIFNQYQAFQEETEKRLKKLERGS